ncbi:MAG: PKD domain-containing protein, partial [Candidatus Thalassarchaeaceae archaeon]|nr:PKD domain-containing protein [Candidatus Thalassarchaeaceae archaeon]
MQQRELTTLVFSALLLTTSLAGCSGISSTTPNAVVSADQMSVDVGETVNFDARQSSTPSPTIIDEYVWDFGDGEDRTTTVGISFHTFTEPGHYDVEVEVFNDQGESDRASVTIFVNSPPTIVLEMPNFVRTNESATLDASESFDFEGAPVEFMWDLNLGFDSNNDGDSTNDADDNNDKITISYAESGNMSGMLMVIDDTGAVTKKIWHLTVIKRIFNIVWEEQTIEHEYNGYTEQGESTIITNLPGEDGRLIQVNATLTLSRDLLPIQWPEDNFTLKVSVPLSGWVESVQTTQENITLNSTATISRESMNPYPNSGYT